MFGMCPKTKRENRSWRCGVAHRGEGGRGGPYLGAPSRGERRGHPIGQSGPALSLPRKSDALVCKHTRPSPGITLANLLHHHYHRRRTPRSSPRLHPRRNPGCRSDGVRSGRHQLQRGPCARHSGVGDQGSVSPGARLGRPRVQERYLEGRQQEQACHEVNGILALQSYWFR